MSEPGQLARSKTVLEGRRVIASYPTYLAAEGAVDYLSDQKFPVERVTIVGQGLKLVEQVTGRMTWAKAAGRGLLSGAIAGGLIGWLFAVFNWSNANVARGWLIVDGLWFGALAGLLTGLVMQGLTLGRRDFTSVGSMQADRYDLLVDESSAEEARRLLRELPGT